jgi:poly-gamma-glutamate synthesis protein (capsule biosynthesis protein)
VDDYAVDRRLRNDLGLLFLISIDDRGPAELQAVPLALDGCRTRLADTSEAAWLGERLAAACVEWGTEVAVTDQGRLVVSLR